MGSQLGFAWFNDDRERREALDPRRSFIVQAPAGSGKTELLIQRYLKLLGVAEKPERIFAMTFTRKAAAEMRQRILGALTRVGEIEVAPHEKVTQDLARAALKRSDALRWDLLENPGRIRVQTIDALCGSLVAQMPWLARQGSLPKIVEEADSLYRSAAQRTVLMVERESRYSEWLEHLLLHLDNKTSRMGDLVASMLAKRDQWIDLAFSVDDDSREEMERVLETIVDTAYEAVERLVSREDSTFIREEFGPWDEAVERLLTKTGTVRKDVEKEVRGARGAAQGER